MYDINDHVIINQHCEYLQKNIKLKSSQCNKVLQSIYWIRKTHNNPIKPRFITTSLVSLLWSLTNSITSVFKVIFQIVENCSNKYHYSSGINTFWTDLNSKAMITAIQKLIKKIKQRRIYNDIWFPYLIHQDTSPQTLQSAKWTNWFLFWWNFP